MINDKNRSQKILTFKTDRNRTSIQLSLAFRPFQVEIFQPVIQNCPKFTSKVTFDNDFSTVFILVGRTDSKFSEIRMGPGHTDADCVISNKNYSDLLNHLSKMGKSQVIRIFSSCKNFPIF